jgi:hypothetical protein
MIFEKELQDLKRKMIDEIKPDRHPITTAQGRIERKYCKTIEIMCKVRSGISQDPLNNPTLFHCDNMVYRFSKTITRIYWCVTAIGPVLRKSSQIMSGDHISSDESLNSE